ncbi:acyl-CoA thioesterase II [Yamadazyma tenuis]|uniref:Thioesterase/thiol ester dehydrase-isomerase n=1 Tax=Candida tenuis (strain ATCC 10573 / BCRC 21748 / CBS 615 / JCM 9827 / NBRC 10315 / NRRL Y-1498 / VKM Y-70) TaxID=590646 RepID=G3B368_CANTC|nr:Thioesterase/thiol ester dehydrase-isomerase [Yamadazyma tenuis ATCC 10573]XP_006686678.1 uncharacterized protein CANTEDRAFT_114133 [Yamadazyma tenuis ATCC 10573]EGV64363.1 Thioesterase/thiol ester dehydrase-isomerase [Yamadazyma tenuis ATCC 10573]EGV64364.1 hypothetical protein CANTEDRAFT_114133 [Yamadazyma tenuis ATCC 10573]WEJ96273.1 acyl-CoA thioesterase II [Yamadazyma tenuis]
MYKSRQYEVVKRSEELVYGRRPLQSIDQKVTKLVFGGELIAQSIMAAWETLEDGWTPNSFHSYFMRPASTETVIRYEISSNSDGHNYKNRLVHCYQEKGDKLCFIAMISFAQKNDMKKRQLDFQNSPNPNVKNVPFDFQFSPNEYFYKYKDRMEELMVFNHTNDHISAMIPPEIFEDAGDAENQLEVGERRLGFFTRVNVDGVQPVHKKWNYVDFAFVSDATTLVLFYRCLGTAFSMKYFWYTYATMDHNIYFHDDDFNITDWLFVDFRFVRLSNGRVLFLSFYFNRDGKLVASITQEAQVQIPQKVADKATSGSYKL